VLIAILTDIHGNREALEACLAHAGRRPIDRYVFLGDLVGYGADPGFVIDTAKDFSSRGAIVLLGNHDSAAIGNPERMNDEATLAIEWTRRQLTGEQREFLKSLPLTATEKIQRARLKDLGRRLLGTPSCVDVRSLKKAAVA